MKLFKLLSLLVLSAALAYSQTALTRTTFSAAVTATDQCATLASASGVTAAGIQVNTVIWSGRELFRVSTVSGTRVCFSERGAAGSRIHAHASGDQVLLGAPAAFGQGAPVAGGTCSATDQRYKPLIVPSTGEMYDCDGTNWLRLDNSAGLALGTAVTGVTAYEYGDSRTRKVKLTFTDLAIGSSGGAADLAFGKLIYTLSAGTWVVNSAKIAVGLTGSGASCDADTPDGGLGSVVGSGVVAVLGGTGTFEDFLTGQTFNDATGTVETKTVSQAGIVELAGVHTVYFNLADGWAAACDFTGTGTVLLDLRKLD
jgi:hypothetical protein